ncbi:hypothetical protein chiPu_0013571 [Chiloscyllium punctatum]|uniref:Uncharacterized protein n=1 Tax=Chiloscyllium punctatum TaxID=137246 RepID=A0A401SXI0_CHIPU|nr:hypothetical protein [Chiloscyllium punctatum]
MQAELLEHFQLELTTLKVAQKGSELDWGSIGQNLFEHRVGLIYVGVLLIADCPGIAGVWKVGQNNLDDFIRPSKKVMKIIDWEETETRLPSSSVDNVYRENDNPK